MKKNPLVSIIIPVYNGSDYLAEAIDSALLQSYNNIEILVINDGSNDSNATKKIMDSYGNKIISIHKKNGGVASALNVGIKEMHGEYFSWLSHDDLYKTDKIEKEMKYMHEQEGLTIVGCNVDVVNYKCKLIKQNTIPNNGKKSITSYLSFDQKTGLNGCSLLIPKKCFEECGFFNEDLKVTQDYDMWYRLAKKFKFAFINDNLVLSRQHNNQGSRTLVDDVTYEVDRLHSKCIKDLTSEELMMYCDNIIDLYENYYLQYKDMHCVKSAIETAIKYIELLKLNGETDKATIFINNNFLRMKDDKFFFDIFKYKNIKQKTLIFFNNTWIKGGIERVLNKNFSYLIKDYNIYFIAFKIDENEGYKLPKEVHKIEISNDLDYMLPGVLMGICKLLDADIFIGNQNLLDNYLPVYKILCEENIKSIACNHYNYTLPFEQSWLNKFAIIRNDYTKYANACTWATHYCTDMYNCINSNGYYLPNPNTYDIAKTIPSKMKYSLLSVARFDDVFKRIDLLLNVFSKVIKIIPEAKLTIVGNVDFSMKLPETKGKTLRKYLNSLKIPDNSLVFVGEKNNLEKYYSEAECFILTSETEGFGMVINEAACFGTPSIAFNISGLEDLISDGKNGYLIDKNDTEKMSEAICNLLLDDKKKKDFSYESLKHAKEFSVGNVEHYWNSLLNKILNGETIKNKIEDEKSKLVKKHEEVLIKKIKNNMIINSKKSLVKKTIKYLKCFGLRKTIKKIIDMLFRKKQ